MLLHNKHLFKYILISLASVISFPLFVSAQGFLKVDFLDVGQGDAIYVEAPNGHQMIIDGGPRDTLIRVLPEVMPFGDKSIDVIMVTNPDADHMGGFISLLKQYDIGSVIESGTLSDTKTYKELEDLIKKEKCPHVIARKGMYIVLDYENKIYFEVIFPDQNVSKWKRNDGSIVGKIVYGDTSIMMMGDATVRTEGIILSRNDKNILKSTVLKLGHHGSKTSSSLNWIKAVNPSLAIISAGKNNHYGHPHQEVLNRLISLSIPYLGTYKEGSIQITSDGKNIKID